MMEPTLRLQSLPEIPISRQLLLERLGYPHNARETLAALVENQFLILLKDGLYVPGPASGQAYPEPFLIANHLCDPSYVSLDAALSFWGMIPERVYETTSVTVKADQEYQTPVGRFSYHCCAFPYYCLGIQELGLTTKQQVLIASPEKALCDKLTMTPYIELSNVDDTLVLLSEDLRIDEEELAKLDTAMIDSWASAAPQPSTLKMLAEALGTLQQ